MIDSKDIRDRIESDFGSKALVVKIFNEAISKADYINQKRILRCILFLAEKDIEKLKKFIDSAIWDPRDVMFWAEYASREELENARRERDFNKPFNEAEKNVSE